LSVTSEIGGFLASPDSLALAPMSARSTVTLPSAFVITIPSGSGEDVTDLALSFRARDEGGTTFTSRIPFLSGSTFGLSERFESEPVFWAHGVASEDHRDEWRHSTERAGEGLGSMKCGAVGSSASYADSLDAVLESPPCLLGAGSSLRFLHCIDAEIDGGGDAFDGARVEVSLDGVSWAVVTPDSGYTHDPVANATFALFDGPVWSGVAPWRESRVDLGAFDGRGIRVRFRFASDGINDLPHEGWFIDDVEIETDGSPIAYAITPIEITSSLLRFRWSVVENTVPVAATVQVTRRSPIGADPVTVTERALEESYTEVLTELPLAPGEARRYELVELVSGAPVVRAELTVTRPALPPTPVVLSAGPSPLRAGLDRFRVSLSHSNARVGDLRVFAITGRELVRVAPRTLSDRIVLEWDTRLDGRRAPPGVYFYRIDGLTRGGHGRIVVTP
jgi:hypothetical protein